MAIVVGGGNFWREQDQQGHGQGHGGLHGNVGYGDELLALQDAFLALGVPTRVQTSIEMREIAEPYARRKALSQLEHGDIVIFGAGTGNPFFSTDTTAALRAAEMDAEIILLAKNVDAVYDKRPAVHSDARKLSRLTHMEVLEKDLKVMDLTAATLCRDNHIKIHVSPSLRKET